MIRWLAPLLALAAFLYGLVVMAPVSALYGWFAPDPLPVRLSSLDGTLVKGRMAGLSQGPRQFVDEANWQLRPGALLLGSLRYQLDGQALGSVFSGQVRATPTGRLGVDGLQAAGSVKALLQALGQGFLPVDGQFRLDIDEATVHRQWPQSLSGTLTLQGMVSTLLRDPLRIGDFQAVLSTEPGPDDQPPTLLATVQSLDGPLEVEGTARQFADRRQVADLRVRAKADAPPMLRNMLNGLGRPDAQGWYRIQRTGRLP